MIYKLAIFDLDGTILNTLTDLANSVNHSLQKFNFPTHSHQQIRRFLGNGVRNLIEQSVPQNTSQSVIEQVVQEFLCYYGNHCEIATQPYDGIPQLLASLKEQGMKLAVVSNKIDFAVQKLCAKYFDGLLDVAVGERQGIRKKPCPDSVICVMKELGFDATNTVYVGDSEVDLQTANNANIPCIAVTWGFRDTQDLLDCEATTIVDDALTLQKQLLN